MGIDILGIDILGIDIPAPTPLNILFQLAKFEAVSCNSFQDIFLTSFQYPNLQRAITKKTKYLLLPGDLVLIFYQLIMFEARSDNNFPDIFTTSFQCPNLRRAIAQIK